MTTLSAILGPTNTGKTHLAIERMLEHPSAVMGLPLRLLAREVYDKLVRRVGPDKVALITGEEKIAPQNAVYTICTTEAMPEHANASLIVLDEIQLCADPDRGHIFTDRLLNLRGTEETLLLGAHTMAPILKKTCPNIDITLRNRFSDLIHTGYKKITRLPKRSAIIAFSAEDVYAIAELIKRQSGGAAIVLGALSPRTRNAQVALFENGEVDTIVATDAIGMGLNLNIEHVAFAANAKFDGTMFRPLTAAELGQIAGRAGRYMNNGTFGTTADCPKLDDDTIKALETHRFDTIKTLEWRSTNLDFSSAENLLVSLTRVPTEDHLTLTRPKDDLKTLDALIRRQKLTDGIHADIKRAWELCQLPDYRKISMNAHIDLIETLLEQTQKSGTISDTWLEGEIRRSEQALSKKNPGVDAIMQSLSHMRTWAYIANQTHWLKHAAEFQARTKELEVKLSDQLHAAITKQFVDVKTSTLLKQVANQETLPLSVKGNHVCIDQTPLCVITGLNFALLPQATTKTGKKLQNAAKYAARQALKDRMTALISADPTAFNITLDGAITYNDEPVATLKAGVPPLGFSVELNADDSLDQAALKATHSKLDAVVNAFSDKHIAPLLKLQHASKTLSGASAGIAFSVLEGGGIATRDALRETLKTLTQDDKTTLRKFGIRFGHSHIYIHDSLKPETRKAVYLLAKLHKHSDADNTKANALLNMARAGRTSMTRSFEWDNKTYTYAQQQDQSLLDALGYVVLGERLLRIDILDRFQEDIRKRVSFRLEDHRPSPATTEPTNPEQTPQSPIPEGAALGSSFYISKSLCALLGCSVGDVETVLTALGYVPKHVKTDTLLPALPQERHTELKFTQSPPITDAAGDEQTPSPTEQPLPDTVQIWFFPKKKPHKQGQKPHKSFKGKKNKPTFDNTQGTRHHNKSKSNDPSPFDALKGLINEQK